MLAPFVCACRFGTDDVNIGSHHVASSVSSDADGPGGADGSLPEAGEAGMLGGDCTLLRSEGLVSYAIGEVGRLEGAHVLAAKHSAKCAEARGCDSAEAVVEQGTCDLSRCQMWQSLEVADGWFVINNARTGGCFDVGNGSLIDGGGIQAWSCHARANQQWQAVCAGDNSWKIVNKNSGLLLRVVGNDDGDIAQQWSDLDSPSERWDITSRPDAYGVLMPTSEDAGQSWSYTTEMPAAGWESTAFDAASWQQGLAPFGARHEAPWAQRTEWNGPDIWLRRDLDLAMVPTSLDVRIFHNGPVEAYINGSLAYEGSFSNGYRVVPANAAALASLVVGKNSVAVHCRQNVDQSFGPFIDVGFGRLVWK